MDWRAVLGALCWLATVQFVAAVFHVAVGMVDYAPTTQDLSVLGSGSCVRDTWANWSGWPCSPRGWLYNASLVLHGALVALGAGLLGGAVGWVALPRMSVLLIALGGIGGMVAGFQPHDASALIHGVGASADLLLSALGIGAAGHSWREAWPIFARYCRATAGLSLGGLALYYLNLDAGLGRGTMELVAIVPLVVWFPVAGLVILASVARAGRPAASPSTAKAATEA